MSQADDAIGRNIQRAMSGDGPPRLRCDMEMPILAKDTVRGLVLVGGLGPFGVGRMWFKLGDHHLANLTYAEAPDVDRATGVKR